LSDSPAPERAASHPQPECSGRHSASRPFAQRADAAVWHRRAVWRRPTHVFDW